MAALILISLIIVWKRCDSKPNYCQPSDTTCWPTRSEINDFNASVSQLVLPTDNDYDIYINMTQDLLYRNRYPSFVVICENVEDIQKSVLFASSHNIQISICSTGHSYSGRNNANNSLQIILSKMRGYKINQDESTITVGSGLQWGSIYGLAAPNIVVGPNDPSVGPAGYSLRGGHSPVSPHYGLASDFTTEYFMVDANANIVHIYNTSGKNQSIDDLFWSLKGGGGSTFGVIVNITFLMHKPETGVFTRLMCGYPFYQDPVKKEGFILDTIFNNLWEAVKTELDQNWGGYLFTYTDSLFINVLYYGNSTYAMKNAQPFFRLTDPYKNVVGCENFTIYQTFEDYIVTQGPYVNGKVNAQLFNHLIAKENLTEEYTDILVEFFNASHDGFTRGLSGIFQGGKVNSFPDDYTSACPGFRHNQFEIYLGVVWTNPNVTNTAISFSHEWESKFMPFGIGKYSNEENYECGNGCNWKQQFFGTNYDKLLKVKQIWDPNQVFWCNHCVASDLD